MSNKTTALLSLALVGSLAGTAQAVSIYGTYDYFDAETNWSSNDSNAPDQKASGTLNRVIVGVEKLYGSYQFGDLDGIEGNPFTEKHQAIEVGYRIAWKEESTIWEGRIYGRYTTIKYDLGGVEDALPEEKFWALGYRTSPSWSLVGKGASVGALGFDLRIGADLELNVFYFDADTASYDQSLETNSVGFAGEIRPFASVIFASNVGQNGQLSFFADVGYQYSYISDLTFYRMYYGMDFRGGLKISF